MVISNNQDSHDDDKGGNVGDPNDDADADDTIIFLSPWPPVATHPPLLARHWAICDEFIDYRAYRDHPDYHLLSYLYVICVIRCLIECDPLYSVPWPVHMHCHHPILSCSLSSKLLSSPILDHQIITNHPLHSVHDLFTFIVTIPVISSWECSVSSKLLSSSNHHKFTSVSDLDLQRRRSLVP